MNKEKNELCSLIHARKNSRTAEEIRKNADVFISTDSGSLSSVKTSFFSDKALLIALRSLQIEKQKKQSVVSSLPMLPNHMTDLHIAALMAYSLSKGRSCREDFLQKCRRALSEFYRSPKPDQIFPGLLEKNLMKKLFRLLKK